MPYRNIADLPDSAKTSLPRHALEIHLAAFNHAWDQYQSAEDRHGDASREEVAHKVAWSVVKQKYEKKGDEWRHKNH